MNFAQKYNSPLGKITLVSDGENLIVLWFDGQKYFGDVLGENFAEKFCRFFLLKVLYDTTTTYKKFPSLLREKIFHGRRR